MFEQEDKHKYEDVDFNITEYLSQVQAKSDIERKGILVLPTKDWQQSGVNVFMSETFDFVKWVKQKSTNDFSISVATTKDKRVAEMKSDNILLPLVYLFSNVSIPIYLNMVANYLYDKLKGKLGTDKTTVNLEVRSEDKKKGKVKRFSYHGSYEGFQKIVKKMDINEFME